MKAISLGRKRSFGGNRVTRWLTSVGGTRTALIGLAVLILLAVNAPSHFGRLPLHHMIDPATPRHMTTVLQEGKGTITAFEEASTVKEASSSRKSSVMDLFHHNVWYSSYIPKTAPKAPPLKYPIWWAGPFRSGSGYGSEAITYALGLLENGLIRPEDLWVVHSGDILNAELPAKLEPHVWAFIQQQDYANISRVLTQSELSRPAIVVCHSFPDCWERPGEWQYPELPGVPCPPQEMEGRYIYRVGRTMFETSTLPRHLSDHVNQFDEVWVPSEFNRQSFIAGGVDGKKLYTLPQGINTTVFNPALHTPLPLPQLKGTELATGRAESAGRGPHGGEKFVFLSIFKWEGRKGWEILLRAFVEEFKAHENVELHIATHAFIEKVPNWVERIRQSLTSRCGVAEGTAWTSLPRIYVTSAFISDEQYPQLYKAADALVIPTRGEGWGRPQMEAMSMGLPVISTNWSGLTAFLHPDVAYPIPIEGLVEAKYDGPSFFNWFAGTHWAQPSLSELKRLMRRVVTHRQEARAKGAAARRYVVQEFGPEGVARKLQALIRQAEKRADAVAAERLRAKAVAKSGEKGPGQQGEKQHHANKGEIATALERLRHAAEKQRAEHLQAGDHLLGAGEGEKLHALGHGKSHGAGHREHQAGGHSSQVRRRHAKRRERKP
eukprot:CAMPEP_0202898984 /NCGR_PEP_ID=MMETSP1392-20130828/7351_1 /ASSEMBLY_ACC=CAM_ASM_000868 /TAXON_ID=225041 /ORGANISM="Chlamydomonas chlamydogama, Strain SAG 11-48b" /LENGTH=663 /DNA_ID=CAMNT_0049585063 /DNA_START=247 /DNA_END=2238 /DNA_ORIENTATION=+